MNTPPAFPEVRVFHARLESVQPQHVPPLPTTALHGALGHALKRLACFAPHRESCEGCTETAHCPYLKLFEPPGSNLHFGAGTDRAPAPMVLSPDRAALGKTTLPLRPGEALGVRFVFIGSEAIGHAALVRLAVEEAVVPGLGSDRLRPARDGIRMRLASFVPLPPEDPGDAPERARLHFVTPVRLKDGEKIASRITAELFWRTLARRISALSVLYGGQSVELPAEPGFSFSHVRTRVVNAERYSARQGTRMSWPGVVGSAVVEGPGMSAAWPWLKLGELLQVGKATTFGFGRYVLTGLR